MYIHLYNLWGSCKIASQINSSHLLLKRFTGKRTLDSITSSSEDFDDIEEFEPQQNSSSSSLALPEAEDDIEEFSDSDSAVSDSVLALLEKFDDIAEEESISDAETINTLASLRDYDDIESDSNSIDLIMCQIDENQLPASSSRTLSPPNYKTRLFLGEANFSFTAAFLTKHKNKPGLASCITATSYDSRDLLESKYSHDFWNSMSIISQYPECKILFNIDARYIDKHPELANQRFHRIHFNFPHDGESYDKRSIPLMLIEFFTKARRLQDIGDRIHMALPTPSKIKALKYYQGFAYAIDVVTKAAGYRLIRKRRFDALRYPGYLHSKERDNNRTAAASSAREFVFEKTPHTYDELTKMYPSVIGLYDLIDHKRKIRKTTPMLCLPHINTDEESSDCESNSVIVKTEVKLRSPKRDKSIVPNYLSRFSPIKIERKEQSVVVKKEPPENSSSKKQRC